jgi:hypothetical protein
MQVVIPCAISYLSFDTPCSAQVIEITGDPRKTAINNLKVVKLILVSIGH